MQPLSQASIAVEIARALGVESDPSTASLDTLVNQLADANTVFALPPSNDLPELLTRIARVLDTQGCELGVSMTPDGTSGRVVCEQRSAPVSHHADDGSDWLEVLATVQSVLPGSLQIRRTRGADDRFAVLARRDWARLEALAPDVVPDLFEPLPPAVVVTAPDSQNLLKKTLEDYEHWLAGSQLESWTAQAGWQLAMGTVDGFRTVPLSLELMGLHHGRSGVLELIRGEVEEARASLAHAMSLHAWVLAIKVQLRKRGQASAMEQLLGSPLERHLGQLTGLVACSEEWCGFAAELLAEAEEDPSLISASAWAEHGLARFVRALRRMERDGANAPDPEDLDGPYRGIAEAWNDEAALPQALGALCDHQVELLGPSYPPEAAPFDLLPCGLMAVQTVRTRRGQSTPVVPHPLLTKLGGVPDPIPAAESDDLLNAIARRYAGLLQ